MSIPSLQTGTGETLPQRADKLVEELGSEIDVSHILPEAYDLIADARWLEDQRFSWGVSQETDQLAYSMAEADAKGFMAHDNGNFEAAEAYFFVKEANMFTSRILEGELNLEDVYMGAKAYTNTLKAKDCVEWANLSKSKKKDVANRTDPSIEELNESFNFYTDMSSTELFERLDEDKMDVLGVREVNSRDFMVESKKGEYDTGWESLLNDEEGLALVEEFSKQRARRVGIDRDIYTEGWFMPHKTVSPFGTTCKMARCAEQAAATNVTGFHDAALVYNSDNPVDKVLNNPKPSDGLFESSLAAQKYVEAVQAHDFKTSFALVRMTTAAAPYYKVSLMDHFDDSVEQSMRAMEDSIYTYNEGAGIWHAYMDEYATAPGNRNEV